MGMEYLDHEYYNSDDALSFCDLPVLDKDDSELDPFLDSYRQRNSSSPGNHDRDHDHDHDHDDDIFEFFVSPEILSDHNTNIRAEKKNDQGIVFCGVPIIPPKAEPTNTYTNGMMIAINNSRHTRSGRFIRRSEQSPHLKKCQASSRSSDVVVSNRGSSFRFGGGPKRPNNNYNYNLPANGSSRCRGGGGGSYRKHNKVIMGLVRFQAAPKMELSEMRRRQSRRNPVPMFPVGDRGGEPGGAVVGDRSHWGFFRPLRCRAHFVSAWTKASFRCL